MRNFKLCKILLITSVQWNPFWPEFFYSKHRVLSRRQKKKKKEKMEDHNMWTSRASTREEIINQREPRPHFFHLLSTTGCPRNNRITFRVLITRYREELGLRATECAVKRLSSHVTRRIPITKSSRDKFFVSFPALTRCYSGSTVLTVRWIHQIFRIAVPSFP